MASPLLIHSLDCSRSASANVTRLMPYQPMPKPTKKTVTFQLPEGYQSVNTYIADELDCGVVSITVGTGDSQKSFNIHKNPLCKRIPYFDKMFNGSFEEATTQRAIFPEDDPVAFKLLIGWVYTKVIEIPKDENESPVTYLLRLFVLAENFMAPTLADEAIDLLSKYCGATDILPHIDVLNEEYKETPKDSKLRLWIARAMAHQFRSSPSDSYEAEPMKVLLADNVDLLGDFLSALNVLEYDSDGSKPSDPTDFPPCDYHQHAESEPCPYAKDK